jgi:hypothetical protein
MELVPGTGTDRKKIKFNHEFKVVSSGMRTAASLSLKYTDREAIAPERFYRRIILI